MTPDRRYALATGLLYFSTHVSSVAAALLFSAAVAAGGGPAGSGPLDAGLIRASALLEVVLALGCVGTGVALLPVLSRYAPALAYGFLSLRVVEAAVIAGGTLPLLAVLTATEEVRPALFELHEASFLVGQGLVIGLNTLVIGWAIWRTRIVLPWIGALGLLGGTLVLVGNLLQLYGMLDRSAPVAAVFALPVFAFEICFAGYLVFKGFRTDPRLPRAGGTAAAQAQPL